MTALAQAPATAAGRPTASTCRLARHSGYLTVRSLRALWRQPAFAAATLVQPVIWLLLFGQLFRSVVTIPGFGTGHGPTWSSSRRASS